MELARGNVEDVSKDFLGFDNEPDTASSPTSSYDDYDSGVSAPDAVVDGRPVLPDTLDYDDFTVF